MTNQEIEQVKQLSEKGYSWTEIAKLMSKTISAIHWVRRTQNLKSKNKKISQSQIDEIIQLAKDGYSLKYVIEKTGLHKNTIEKYVHDANLIFTSKPSYKINRDKLIQLLEDEKTTLEIAEYFGVSNNAIRKYISKNNIMGVRQRIRNKNLNNVKELHNKGLLILEIAQKLNLHEQTVKSCLKELHLSPNKNRLVKLYQELEPEDYLSKHILSIPEEKRKDFIIGAVKQYIILKQKYVSRKEFIYENQKTGITDYYISKYRVSIPEINLTYGLYKQSTIFEEQITKYLQDEHFNFTCQKTFDTCRSNKGELLRFDFYLIDKNVLIEADGQQHVDPNSPWSSIDQFERDKIKDKWCKDNNIVLIRIPYKRVALKKYLDKFLNDYK